MTRGGRWLACALLSGCEVENELPVCPTRVVVNEIMAAGRNVAFEGRKVDWVELYNASAEPVDLDGWNLSRTPDLDFNIESVVVPSGGFLVLITDTFDDGENTRPVTFFDLNRDGDALFLRAPDTSTHALCDEVVYPDQHADFSWKRVTDGADDWCFATTPTPEGTNDDAPCMCGDPGASEWC